MSMCLHFDSWCSAGFNHRGTSNITQTLLFNIPFICFSSLFLSVGRFLSDYNISPDFCSLSSFAILRWLWKAYDKLLISQIYAYRPHWVGFILNTFWNHISTFRSASYFLINYCLDARCYFKYMKESSFQVCLSTFREE